MSKNLLVISQRPEDQTFAIEVALTAGMSLKTAPDALSGAAMIAEDTIAVVLADVSNQTMYQALENAIQESVGLFSDKINANAIHFLSSEELDQAPYLIQSPLFGHFVLRNFGDPKAAGQHYGRIVQATQADRAFGLDKLVKPGTKVQTVRLASSTQKQEAVEAVKGFLVAAKFQSRMASSIANAVDELLMNSIFDAPVDELGKHIYNEMPRSSVLALDGKAAVEMQIAFDGQYVAITACDNFGSLDKVKLFSHIAKVYKTEEYKVRTTSAGAGIGLATVFRSGGSFFFVSESHSRTEVTVFFKRLDSFREFKDQFRFISTQFYF